MEIGGNHGVGFVAALQQMNRALAIERDPRDHAQLEACSWTGHGELCFGERQLGRA